MFRNRTQQPDGPLSDENVRAVEGDVRCAAAHVVLQVGAAPIEAATVLAGECRERLAGLDPALMERATEHALSTGAVRIDLSTALDNAPAQALYEDLGYHKDSEFFVYSLDLESQRDSRSLRRTPPSTSTP